MGLGPHIEFDCVQGEGVGAKRAPGLILMGPDLFKRCPRRNVSSDILSMAQIYTLPVIKNHSNEY